MKLQQCPSAQQLSDYNLGKLSDADLEAVADHLDRCGECTSQLDALELQADEFIERVRQPAPEDFVADDSEMRELLSRTEALLDTSVNCRSETSTDRRVRPKVTEAELQQMLLPAQADGEIGRLGGYRVLEVLGAGGMGVVFRAEDPDLQRPLALKVMLPSLSASSEAAKDRFLREARATAAVHHDHIVTIHQVGEDRDIPFLAMQLLSGESLAARLQREGTLPADDVLRIGREIALGLQAAHQRGLTHRDIKPDNIWLEADTGRVKLVDFGLARTVDDPSNLTQSGAIIGTPSFLSPEQARGEPVDHRADLFSVGVVLYQLTTGTSPFARANMMATLNAVTLDEPDPPASVKPKTPAALSDLIMRLLEKSPDERVQSADELIEELATVDTDASATSAPPPRTASDRSWLGARGRRLLAVAAAVAALLLLATVIYIRTDRGTIVVEASDGFEITTADQIVTIRDKATDRTFKVQVGKEKSLPSGDYQILVEDNGGLKFKADEFTVKRGARRFSVRLEAADSGAGGGGSSGDDHLEPMSLLAMVQNPQKLTTSDGEKVLSHTLEPMAIMGTTAAAVSPDGKLVATFSDDGMIRIWDPTTLKLVQMLVGHAAGPLGWSHLKDPDVIAVDSCLSWNPDSRRLAAADQSGQLIVWDTVTGLQLGAYRHSTGNIDGFLWSPDGSQLAVLSDDPTVRVLASNAKPIADLEHASGIPRQVAWSPDSQSLAVSLDRDNKLCVWDVESRTVQRLQCPSSLDLTSRAWSPDGKRIAARSKTAVMICDVASGEMHEVFDQASAVAWSSDGAEIFAFHQTGTAPNASSHLTRIKIGVDRHQFDLGTLSSESSIAPLADGKHLLMRRTQCLLNLETGELRTIADDNIMPRSRLHTSQDASVCALSSAFHGPAVVVNTDVLKGDAPRRWHRLPPSGFRTEYSIPIRGIASSEQFIATCGKHDAGVLIDRSSGLIRQLDLELGHLTGVQFSPDGKLLLLLSRDGTCIVISTETREKVAQFRSRWKEDATGNDSSSGGAAAFSHDGQRVAVVGWGGVRIHGVPSGELQRKWGSDLVLSGVAWSPDGRWLAVAENRSQGSAGYHRGPFRVRVYDAERKTEKVLSEFPQFGGTGLRELSWSPDGKYLAATADFGPAGPQTDPRWVNQLVVWDASTWKSVLSRPVPATALRFDDSTTLVYATRDGQVVYESVATGKELRRIQAGVAGQLVEFTPDGTLLQVNGDRIRVHHLPDGKLQATVLPHINGHSEWAVVSPDGHYDGSPDAHQHLRHVVRSRQGTRILTPFEFTQEFGWKNDPKQVALPVNPATSSQSVEPPEVIADT